jgi:hypothetical protein
MVQELPVVKQWTGILRCSYPTGGAMMKNRHNRFMVKRAVDHCGTGGAALVAVLLRAIQERGNAGPVFGGQDTEACQRARLQFIPEMAVGATPAA